MTALYQDSFVSVLRSRLKLAYEMMSVDCAQVC
jgi:hypothetical protein